MYFRVVRLSNRLRVQPIVVTVRNLNIVSVYLVVATYSGLEMHIFCIRFSPVKLLVLSVGTFLESTSFVLELV